MKRPRKRPHVRDPKDGFCPGCDDELGAFQQRVLDRIILHGPPCPPASLS